MRPGLAGRRAVVGGRTGMGRTGGVAVKWIEIRLPGKSVKLSVEQ